MSVLSHFFNKAFLWSLVIVYLACLVAMHFKPAEAAAPKSSCPVHWVISKNAPEYAPYKNDRLISYQDMLCDRGITNKNDLRLFSAQLLDENGALNESTIGDHGCSFGIIQYNACAHAHESAKAFLAKNPQWKNYYFQLHWMADQVGWRYNNYANTRLAVVAHNSPYAANHNKVTSYFYKVKGLTASLTTL